MLNYKVNEPADLYLTYIIVQKVLYKNMWNLNIQCFR